MKWFPFHIIIKDLSFMMFHFVIMKYNLTNETYLPETISAFPGAPDMSLFDMIGVSLFYNILPLVLSLVTYYPIVYFTRKLFITGNSFAVITTGILLTLTTPTIYLALSGWKHNDLKTAEIIAWSLCFISSISTYYLLNKSVIKFRQT
ncbi:MAG: hypothetical protein IPP27_02105 [Bacteroidetes bacterium]|nr:hypothetical protein [Bacteroidota bacterium]